MSQEHLSLHNSPNSMRAFEGFDDHLIFSTSIYPALNTLVSLDSIARARDEMMDYKDTLIDVCSTVTEELAMHGFSEDDISELQNINAKVTEGRDKLLSYLRQYDHCVDEIRKINVNIGSVTKTVEQVERQLLTLSSIHDTLKDVTTPFIATLLEKEQTVLGSLEADLGLLHVQKDKLETLIKALSRTYGILKNSALTHTCPICITHEVDIYLEPCGHTLCRQCSNRSTYCHMCRTKIRVSKSIFYS